MSRFRVFRQLNQDRAWLARWRRRVDGVAADKLDQKGRVDQVIRCLARPRSIRVKELIESLEVYACVRRRLKGRKVVDLCCGHGLTGLLFAVFDRQVEQVILVDRHQTKLAKLVRESIFEAFPEVAPRVTTLQTTLARLPEVTDDQTALIAVHACGSRTDRCLELAIKTRCPVALVPCCYTGTGQDAPAALREALGVPVATDVGRTYRLTQAGFTVEWDSIPEAITPMNRVILARPNPSPTLKDP